MPRRRALTTEQLDELFALPTKPDVLIRYWTFTGADLEAIHRRRRDRNRLGFALQLCALRYPGRLLQPSELIPAEALRFVADQVDIAPESLEAYATPRFQTRYEQLDALRADFGFVDFAPAHRREILAWLLPIAITTTSAATIAPTLMDELRRRLLIVPGPFIVDQLVSAAMVLADRQVAHQLSRGLLPAQAKRLDTLLTTKEGTSMSRLAWARHPPGAPGHRALARLVEQRAVLRAIGIDPACAEGVHPERLRKLAREGVRFTAQHLRALSPLRRRATLIATVLDTLTRLTDDTVALFERAIGRMFRRAEIREQDALIRNARAINDKVRLLAKLGAALIEARESGSDLQEAVTSAIGWDKLWHAASKKQNALHVPAMRIYRPLPCGPGRCCIASGRCFSDRCAFMPFRQPRQHCVQLNCCARFTKAAAGNGRTVCRRAFSGRLGGKPCWARTVPSAEFGRQPPC